jgi:hypothetical protein
MVRNDRFADVSFDHRYRFRAAVKRDSQAFKLTSLNFFPGEYIDQGTQHSPRNRAIDAVHKADTSVEEGATVITRKNCYAFLLCAF